MTELHRYQMFIDGGWTDASDGSTLELMNPTTEEIWALVPDATAADVDRAVEAAQRAFDHGPWPRMTAADRGRCLRKLAACIAPIADELANVETTDTGKLLRETTWQANNVVGIYEYYAGLADKIHGDVPPSGAGQPMSFVLREPVGVVAAIVPWNSQLHLAAYKIAPALAAGNTMVMKASENASGALLEFTKAVEAANFPKGVFNLVTGGGRPCGETLVSHPLVRRVSFTGGVETARKIIPATANNIAKMSLELGGKSPVIVYADADLDSATNGVIAGIFGASGQSCAAGSRLIAHKKIYHELLGRLAERAGQIRIGDPMKKDTDMGPLATLKQRDRIEDLMAKSVDQGARVLTGGGRPPAMNKGLFFEPTIIECDHQDYPVVRQELFGPVLSALKFGDEDEAISMANDSDYAFAGGVFTGDVGRAMRTVRAVRAGRFWVNTYRVSSTGVPFGGFKYSGYGRESGIDAIRDYTETKGVIIETSGQPVADPFIMR